MSATLTKRLALSMYCALAITACGTLAVRDVPSAVGGAAQPTSKPKHFVSVAPQHVDTLAGESTCDRWASTQAIPYQLLAEYDSTAAVVAAWDENLAGGSGRGYVSSFRSLAATMNVVVCYMQGQWNLPVIPAYPSGSPDSPVRDGILAIADNGSVNVIAWEPVSFPVERPAA